MGIIPGVDELKRDAYNSEAAKQVMPATVEKRVVRAAGQESKWNDLTSGELDHPFFHRYQHWFTGNYDITAAPPRDAILAGHTAGQRVVPGPLR